MRVYQCQGTSYLHPQLILIHSASVTILQTNTAPGTQLSPYGELMQGKRKKDIYFSAGGLLMADLLSSLLSGTSSAAE